MRSILSLLFLGLGFLPAAKAQDAAALATQLAEVIEDGDSYTRLRMKIDGTTLQVQVKARRTESSNDVLYQVLYPKERKGESILLKQAGTGSVTGVAFTLPNEVEKLAGGDLSQSLLGGSLACQDVIENFFRWKDQSIEGQEVIDRVECVILVSKPGNGDTSPYGSVRSWIDTKRKVALKVEKYDTGGKLVRTIVTTRVAKDDQKRDLGAGFTIQKQGGGSSTEVEGATIRHDVEWSDDDFTTSAMGDLRINRS